MLKPQHRSAFSSAFLLLVVLTGWIAAPVIHEVSHAHDRAGLVHIHEEQEGAVLRTGCEPVPVFEHDCPLSRTEMHAEAGLEPASVMLERGEATFAFLDKVVDRSVRDFRPVRGPPIRI